MEKNGALSNEELYEKISGSIDIKIENFVILICAIFIASIGLNVNSQPILIGAMLISPLMAPVQGVGLGLGVFDSRLTARAMRLLLLEAGFAVVTALIYFWLSPLTYASSEILARTEPTVWDAIIAILGGTAGMIGARQREANNIVPGVAIATALMPPLCVMGYGIYTRDWSIFLGAGYLFLVNVAFITITTFLVVRLLRLNYRTQVDTKMEHRRHYLMIALAVFIAIPSLISAGDLIHTEMSQQRAKRFVTEAMADYYVLDQTVDTGSQTLKLDLLGIKPANDELTRLQAELSDYNLGNYRLTINQVANNETVNLQDIDRYIDQKLKDKGREQAAPHSTDSKEPLQEIKKQLFLDHPDKIKKIELQRADEETGAPDKINVTLAATVDTESEQEIRAGLERLLAEQELTAVMNFRK